jgi:hypothetical protein
VSISLAESSLRFPLADLDIPISSKFVGPGSWFTPSAWSQAAPLVGGGEPLPLRGSPLATPLKTFTPSNSAPSHELSSVEVKLPSPSCTDVVPAWIYQSQPTPWHTMVVACDTTTNQMLPIVANETEAALDGLLYHVQWLATRHAGMAVTESPTSISNSGFGMTERGSGIPASIDNEHFLNEPADNCSSTSKGDDADSDAVLVEDNDSDADSDFWAWETDVDD